MGEGDKVKFGGGVTVRLSVVVCVSAPDIPWMVTVTGPPVVAEAVADSVNVLDPVVGFGLNDAVTPLGRVEETDRVTLPVKPLVGFTVIALWPLPPWAIVKLLGDGDKVKFGGGVTVRLTVVVLVKPPEMPWTVTVVGPPMVAVALAVSVRVLDPVVVGFGLKPAVTPVGKVEVTDRLTLPVNPLNGFTEIVLVPLLP